MIRNILLILALFNTAAAFASQVDTIQVFSPGMNKISRCVVVLPEKYSFSGERYPVLYLLHGWSGNYAGWLTEAPQLAQQADQYGMIIVCPDGGYDSWYLDSPVDSTVRYDTYISKELVSYIDYYYQTRAEPTGRAIAGLSMGGKAHHTGRQTPRCVWGSRQYGWWPGPSPVQTQRLGPQRCIRRPQRSLVQLEAASAVNMIPLLKASGIKLILDCGTGDFFLEANRSMHQGLLAAGVKHDYTERPGEHNREYWGSAVDFQALFFDKFFDQKK